MTLQALLLVVCARAKADQRDDDWKIRDLYNSPAKDQAERKQQQRNCRSNLCCRRPCNDHIGESRLEKHESPDEQKHQSPSLRHGVSRLGVFIHAHEIVEGEEDNECDNGVPRQFNQDVDEHEGTPGIGAGGAFAGFVLLTLENEVRHCLVDEEGEDNEEHENGEHLRLETLHR